MSTSLPKSKEYGSAPKPVPTRVNMVNSAHCTATMPPSTMTFEPIALTLTPTRRSLRQIARSIINSRTLDDKPNQIHDNETMNRAGTVGAGKTIHITSAKIGGCAKKTDIPTVSLFLARK